MDSSKDDLYVSYLESSILQYYRYAKSIQENLDILEIKCESLAAVNFKLNLENENLRTLIEIGKETKSI